MLNHTLDKWKKLVVPPEEREEMLVLVKELLRLRDVGRWHGYLALDDPEYYPKDIFFKRSLSLVYNCGLTDDEKYEVLQLLIFEQGIPEIEVRRRMIISQGVLSIFRKQDWDSFVWLVGSFLGLEALDSLLATREG